MELMAQAVHQELLEQMELMEQAAHQELLDWMELSLVLLELLV
jgi:hypothetical protein